MSGNVIKHHFDHQSTSSSQETSCAAAESPKEVQTTEDQLSHPSPPENSTNMGQCLSIHNKHKMTIDKEETQPDSLALNSSNGAQTAGNLLDTKVLLADEDHTQRETEGIVELVPNVTRLSVQKSQVIGEEDQRKEETLKQQSQRGVNKILQSDELMDVPQTEDESIPSGEPVAKSQECDRTGHNEFNGSVQASFIGADAAEVDGTAAVAKGSTQEGHKSMSCPEFMSTPLPHLQRETRITCHRAECVTMGGEELSVESVLDFKDFKADAIFTTEEILSPQTLETAEEREPPYVGNLYENGQSCLESSSRTKLYAGKALHRLLSNHPPELEVPTYVQFIRGESVDIDTLSPCTIDGPALCLLTDVKIRNLQRFMGMIPTLRTLRLPRVRSGKDINLKDFFSTVAQQSSSLRELAFEDNGIISNTTANLLFEDDDSEDDKSGDSSCFQKLEVYAPRIPILRALVTKLRSLEKLCLHALTPNLQKDLYQVLYRHGSSLRSLRLGFNLLIEDEPATGIQRRFWKDMIAFLDVSVPNELSQLDKLELSSSPSCKVKHRFNTTFSEGSISATEGALLYITSTIEEKSRTRHPKETEISLGDFRLSGGEELVADALKGLSWVNQDRMGVVVEIPGACAAFQRGYGKVNPVVLQSLQLDQFFFNRVGSEWLGFTSLKEIDLGEPEFVKLYHTGGDSMRKDARKLLVTSRDSLSKVRAHYQMSDRAEVMNTGAILDEIITLAPFVTQLELSRDVIMHANVADTEYVDMMMMLRRWNLKSLHLQSARNYNTVREDSKGHKQAESGFTKFLKGLPAFVTIAAMACPRLEDLVLEWEDMNTEMNVAEAKYMLRNVLSALDVYETTVPTVNAATVRCLMQWYSNRVNEGSKGSEAM